MSIIKLEFSCSSNYLARWLLPSAMANGIAAAFQIAFHQTLVTQRKILPDNGKPAEKRGRKAMGPPERGACSSPGDRQAAEGVGFNETTYQSMGSPPGGPAKISRRFFALGEHKSNAQQI